MNDVIGYEIGEFQGTNWIGFADCTPDLMPREEAEDWLNKLNAMPSPAGTKYRLIEVREAATAAEHA